MKRVGPRFLALGAGLLLAACSESAPAAPRETPPTSSKGDPVSESTLAKATFGAGCFWCIEAVFDRLEGVTAVESGYTGGRTKDPTYREVCTGTTGHAEVAQITFDPGVISFRELLEVFWKTHDPTTLNRQGADVGTQYRSAVFYHTEAQRQEAEALKKALDEADVFDAPIVTEITKLGDYYKAEQDHQDYFKLNPAQGYCRAVIQPKIKKFEEVFRAKLKKKESAR